MFDLIIEKSQTADYDFRKTANPDDPLTHLFNEWVDYYKLKWAIANVLKPASILEIGVRYGYSAAAFLEGHPTAKYLGIDVDSDSYGGVKGANNWAKKITQKFDANFKIADTQKMSRFPGGTYDLIHVDGQQDGDGFFHDLELAINQARYILVDGYFWTRLNFMATNEFLFKYKNIIDYYIVIRGYAGDLLIKIVEEKEVNSSLPIHQAYISEYYDQNSEGLDVYNQNQGKKLENLRLQAIAAIAAVKHQGRVLDLGCGRGELTYFFAKQGFEVTAVDYSKSAIELAKKCFDGEDNLKQKVQFYCESVANISLQGSYDLVVASDLIEHLSVEEVEQLYQKVAQHLKPDGLFVIHTFPNLWYYQYEYPRKRKIAASVGTYLPAQPRTRYEMLMHINEQSPRVLKKQLSKYFAQTLLWLGEHSEPGGSLLRKFSIQEMRAAPSIFAVASQQVLSKDYLKPYLTVDDLPPSLQDNVQLIVTDYPPTVTADSEFYITAKIYNNSEFVLNSYGLNPVKISYHWMDEKGLTSIIFDGERSRIFPTLRSNFVESYQARIKAPKSGKYVLRLTLLQEHIQWFELEPKTGTDVVILVTEN